MKPTGAALSTGTAAEAALPAKAYEIPLDRLRTARRRGERLVDGAFLEPHHTHFLLVDNGTDGMFGKEIELRARLEANIASSASGEPSIISNLCRFAPMPIY